MTDTQKIIKGSASSLMQTYKLQPVALDHGKGCRAYDTDGKAYLDCAAGIAVASLGHASPAVLKTITEQAAKLMICQASYATEPKEKAAKLLIETSCFDKIYFSNSGTESVEAALKLARKWAYEEKGEGCHEIITFHNSFHGRTYGSASITEKRHTQPYFAPYIEGIHYATFNDLPSVKALVSDKTAASILEPGQGEGGLTPADADFLKGLRTLCDENNIALIFDEVQTGFGRLGTLYAYEYFGVEPDIAAWAKGMGAGFPVGAMAARDKFAAAFQPGSHGTTYGGNPLACAVVASVMEEMLKPGFMEHVQKTGKFLRTGLEDLKRSSNKITDIRGAGLMIGVDTVFDIKKLLPALRDNGLMSTQAGEATLRLTPPLIMSEDEAKEALEIIGKTLQEMKK